MAKHSAGHVFFPHSRGEDELQTNPESSLMEPQEECDPQGSAPNSAFTNESEPSHFVFTNEPKPPRSAFTNESEPSHSAFTNEPEPPRSAFANESEPAQTQDHADAMVDPQNAAVESQDRSTSNTVAVKCKECLRKHPLP